MQHGFRWYLCPLSPRLISITVCAASTSDGRCWQYGGGDRQLAGSANYPAGGRAKKTKNMKCGMTGSSRCTDVLMRLRPHLYIVVYAIRFIFSRTCHILSGQGVPLIDHTKASRGSPDGKLGSLVETGDQDIRWEITYKLTRLARSQQIRHTPGTQELA